MKLLPYKKYSKSAKELSKALRIKRLKDKGDVKQFRFPIINWGNTTRLVTSITKVYNPASSVKVAVNKLKTFEALKDKVAIPDFTTDYDQALEWIEDGEVVVCRTLLESHSGKGIVIAETAEQLPTNCKLFVKYFKKSSEFRVHVFNGKVIDFVKKKKRNGIEDANYNKYIRSYNNGWVFCRDGVTIPDNVKTLCIEAVRALNLDFGAVDVCMKSNGKAAILEVNTSPALEGTTLTKYKEAFEGVM